MLIKCDSNKGGCGSTFGINPESVEGDKYIQCPDCDRWIDNPFFDESKEVKERSYVG